MRLLALALAILLPSLADARPTAPAGGLHLYVSTAGDERNDCLSRGAPCDTIMRAVTLAYRYDHPAAFPTIHLAAGTYSEIVAISGQLVGTHVLQIVGDQGTVWTCPGQSAACLTTRDFAIVGLRGVKFVGAASGQIAMQATQQSVIDFLDVEFGDFPLGTHVMSSQSSVSCVGSYTISGGANVHAYAVNNGVMNLNCPTVTIAQPVTINYYAIAAVLGILNGPASTKFVGAENVTGQRYMAAYNAMISLAGGTFPGTVDGETYVGGLAQ